MVTAAALRRVLVATLAAAACGEPETAGILETGEKLYSQFDEELVIRDFFQDRRDGFFVDVGCGPPTRNSTTYYLEKHLGWSGIGVDALPEYAAAWKRERPRSRFFAFLVTDHAGTVDDFYRSEIEGLSSTREQRSIQLPDGRTLTVEDEKVQVPSITLDELLDRNGVETIDLLSMDIELSEPQALAGFDIGRFRPELVCIEAAPSTREAIRRYFDQHGYERILEYEAADPVNWYFEPRG